jgi:hypothetical protein
MDPSDHVSLVPCIQENLGVSCRFVESMCRFDSRPLPAERKHQTKHHATKHVQLLIGMIANWSRQLFTSVLIPAPWIRVTDVVLLLWSISWSTLHSSVLHNPSMQRGTRPKPTLVHPKGPVESCSSDERTTRTRNAVACQDH